MPDQTVILSRLQVKRAIDPGRRPASLEEGEEFINLADKFRLIGDGTTPPDLLPAYPLRPGIDDVPGLRSVAEAAKGSVQRASNLSDVDPAQARQNIGINDSQGRLVGEATFATVTPTGAPGGPKPLADIISAIPAYDMVRSDIATRTMQALAFTVSGYAAKGDRGTGVTYERVANASFPGAIADASGVFYAPKRTGTLPLRAGAYGAKADNTASDTAALNALVTASRSVGSAIRLEAGTYRVDGGGMVLNYQNQSGIAVVQPNGASLKGDGAHNTVIYNAEPSTLADATPKYAIEILGSPGATSTAANFIPMDFGGFTLGRAGAIEALGMHIKSAQSLGGRDVSAQGLNVAFHFESVLSSSFDNFRAEQNKTGFFFNKGSGFSNINALLFNKPIIRANTVRGISSGPAVTAMTLSGPTLEANGTAGDLTTGGAYVEFNSDKEGGTGLVLNGGYVEHNRGGFDFYLKNAGTSQVVHVFNGVTFGQISATNFVQNRIKLEGPSKLLLIGCTFKIYNDYTPSASRPIVDYNPSVSEVVCIGCDLGPAIERNGLRNQNELTFRGAINADGTAAYLPPGWTSVRNSAGSYTIAIPYSLPVAQWSVIAMANNASVEKVEHVFKQPTSFTVITNNRANTATDTAFDFIYRL